jgi:hypothetical protein
VHFTEKYLENTDWLAKPENLISPEKIDISRGMLNPLMLDMSSKKLDSAVNTVISMFFTIRAVNLAMYSEY